MPQPPKLTLYTSNISVYGHRVNILLRHLQVDFEEVLIPLDRPREPWYLAISPRGLVPALKIEDIASGQEEIVVESALICNFLIDLAPSWGEEFAARADKIVPQGHDLSTATRRYRQSLFLDVYYEKLRAAGRPLQFQRTKESQEAFVSAAKELDPVCPQPGRYFGNSETIGLVEVLTGPYLMRMHAQMGWGLIPDAGDISDKLEAEAPKFYAWTKMLAADEGIKAGTWDEEAMYKYISGRFAQAGIQVQK